MPFVPGSHYILVDGLPVSTDNPLPFEFGDSAAIDPVARLRVSTGYTLFDYKHTHDKAPLFFDEVIVNGSGNAASTHVPANADILMHVEAGDSIIRQTFRRFNHQPGKGQNGLFTSVLGAAASGVTARCGIFDDNNGCFFQVTSAGIAVGKRKSAVDTIVAQADWNLDKLDGTGVSGVTIDTTKGQVFSIDFQWLGLGRVRFGIFSDGIVAYCHEFNHSNVSTSVFMTTPNLPIRYSIVSTDATAEMTHICSTVVSEGGLDPNGVLRYFSTNGTHVDANVVNTVYAVVGLRLKSAQLDVVCLIEQLTMLSQTKEDFEWILLFDPVVAGTFTYGDETNSALQTARGATANTVTGGTAVQGGFVENSQHLATSLRDPLYLGSKIDGTQQTLVLCVRPFAANADIQGGLIVRELL